jgi:DNA-binding transcriptional ArsR family regulator
METDLSTIFAALADPTRRAIIARLSAGEAPVKDLVGPLPMSGPAITKHLKVLECAGLISRSREGQQRPCRLEPRALAPAADWIDQYRAMWEERFDRLEAFLQRAVAKPDPPARATRTAQAAAGKTAAAKTTRTKTTAAKKSATKKMTAKKTKSKRPQGGRYGHRK